MIPRSREELHTRILQDLGAPVIEINVATEQVDNAIDDAIQYWQQWHHEAQDHSYVSIKLTKEMIDTNTVPVPESVFAVLSIVKAPGSGNGKVSFMSYEFELTRDAVFDSMKQQGGGIESYVMTKQKFADINGYLNVPIQFDFRTHKRELVLLADMSKRYSPGDFLVIEVHGYLYTGSFNIWGDESLRRLATAYTKRYWGQNLSKFSGVQLPGGVSLNGPEIYSNALQEIDKEESRILDLTEPLGIVIA